MDFSYENDIAPHTSKFFGEIAANRSLSSAARERLQGGLLTGVQEIESQRLKIQEERDQGRMRSLQFEDQVSKLEDARAQRARIAQQESRRAGVNSLVKGILDTNGDPETKRQMLARTALDYADDPGALKAFSIAESAIPAKKDSLISDAQSLALILDGIPQPEIDAAKQTGDYSRIGSLARGLKVQHEAAVENQRLGLAQDKEARAVKLGLARTPLHFDKDGDEESPWLKPESTQHATTIVQTLGTPQEQQRFAALKSANSDRDRASMARDIQLRHLQEVAGVSDDKPDAAARVRSLVPRAK